MIKRIPIYRKKPAVYERCVDRPQGEDVCNAGTDYPRQYCDHQVCIPFRHHTKVGNPKVLVLDEPTEGIQPSIIKDIARTLNHLKAEFKFALVVSEQVLSFTMEIADRFLIMEKGEFVYQDNRDGVDTEKIHAYLTI